MMNIVFLVTGLMFITLLLIIFYSRESIQSIENKYFSLLAKINLTGYIVELLLQISIRNLGPNTNLSQIVNRVYLSFYLLYFGIFTIYTFVISLNKKELELYKKRIKLAKIVIPVSIILGSILVMILPQAILYDGIKMYSYGAAVNVVKYALFIYVFVCMILLIINIKDLKEKKFFPIFLVIFFLTLNGIIQTLDPSIVIGLMVGTFVCYTMFFTIENPDLKMLNELYKNRELMEQGYEDKYNFLFEITQEARNPIININKVCSELKSIDLPNMAKEKVDTLYNLTRQLDFSINGILNISSLDIQKLKIINSKYEIDKLCNDLKIRIKPDLKDNVNFQVFMPKQLPTLYGDYMKIRQILYSLLTNACKNTNNGSINLRVNLIEKYDVCRIIYSISDTGKGMSIDKINDILSATGELDRTEIEILDKKEYNFKVCQKVAKVMGGNIMIKSAVNKGTEVIFTIDQRVFHKEEQSFLTKFENNIINYRKVLLISQRKNIINSIKKKLSSQKITCSTLFNGLDAVDRIKSGRKFDFIIVDDEMTELTGITVLHKLKELKDFDTPVIIMIGNDKENIKEHYIEDGFNDYILVDNLDNDLNKIIDKY